MYVCHNGSRETHGSSRELTCYYVKRALSPQRNLSFSEYVYLSTGLDIIVYASTVMFVSIVNTTLFLFYFTLFVLLFCLSFLNFDENAERIIQTAKGLASYKFI